MNHHTVLNGIASKYTGQTSHQQQKGRNPAIVGRSCRSPGDVLRQRCPTSSGGLESPPAQPTESWCHRSVQVSRWNRQGSALNAERGAKQIILKILIPWDSVLLHWMKGAFEQ